MKILLVLSYLLPQGGGYTELIREPSIQACIIAETLAKAAFWRDNKQFYEIQCHVLGGHRA